ncbi:MAG: hypothetical protein ACE1Y1_01250, partial [Nitrosomonadaceae bacterium]
MAKKVLHIHTLTLFVKKLFSILAKKISRREMQSTFRYYLVRSKSAGLSVVCLTRLLSKVAILFSAHSRNLLSPSDVTEDNAPHINTAKS